MIEKNIKDILVSFRKVRGLDRRNIAEAAGVDYLTVTKWEHGYALPTDDELLRIAESFSVSPEMFGVEKVPVPEPVEQKAEEAPVPEPVGQKMNEVPVPKMTERIELRIDTSVKTSPRAEIICEMKESVKSEPKVELAPTPEEPQNTPETEPTEPVITPEAEPTAPIAQLVEQSVVNIPFSEYEKAYAEKKERYAKYVKSSSYTRASVKIRRMLAYCFDLIFSCAVVLVLTVGAAIIAAGMAKTVPTLLSYLFAGCGACFVGGSLLFVFRDFIFGGRSLGKRVFGLFLIDQRTAEKSAVYQRVLRAVITATPIIDGILLIFRGKTVGDSVASTLVVSKRAYNAPVNPAVNDDGTENYDIPKTKKKNRTALTLLFIFAVVASIVFCAAGTVFAYKELIEEEKKSERYEVAYTYLVESDAFLKSKASESDLHLLWGYIEYSFDSDELVCTYYFCSNSDYYNVVLHLGANTEWYICDICTDFY